MFLMAWGVVATLWCGVLYARIGKLMMLIDRLIFDPDSLSVHILRTGKEEEEAK